MDIPVGKCPEGITQQEHDLRVGIDVGELVLEMCLVISVLLENVIFLTLEPHHIVVLQSFKEFLFFNIFQVFNQFVCVVGIRIFESLFLGDFSKIG